MKKLFMAACMMLGFAGIVSAQTTATKTKPAATDSKMGAVKPATTAKVVKMDKDKPAATAKTNTPTKADGTPDMRYKANKNADKTKTPAGPLKKDGTADMRYKANKDAAAKPVKKG